MSTNGCECREILWVQAEPAVAMQPRPLAGSERRARYVQVDTPVVLSWTRHGQASDCPVVVELFDGERYRMEETRLAEGPQGSLVLHGRLREVPDGEVTMVLLGAALSGTIQARGTRYRIHQVEGVVHRLVELDPRGFLED